MSKGIILAGGAGSRLYPLTKALNKHILPVHDKPMICYPLSTLIDADIKEILIISTERDVPVFKELLGDGSSLGVHIEYAVQNEPKGISEAFIIGKDFIGDDCVTLILGDNVIHSDDNFINDISTSIEMADIFKKASIFGYKVKDPERYGVIEFSDGYYNVIGIEEKPSNPKSNYAIIGVYTYPNSVVEYVNQVKPSERGELEITTLNEIYLKKDELACSIIEGGVAWLDTGTFESLCDASQYVKTIQERQGCIIGVQIPKDD